MRAPTAADADAPSFPVVRSLLYRRPLARSLYRRRRPSVRVAFPSVPECVVYYYYEVYVRTSNEQAAL